MSVRVMELHAPVQTVKRSAGRSSTAAAAYRSASRIECERTGIVHDYTRKRGVEAVAILLPDDAPEWAHDRTALWNQAEAREKRKDAQVAREIEVAFPSEFTPEHRRQAGLQVGQWIVSRYGAATDIAWHEPGREGDQRNHHMHALFTVRRLEKTGWAAKKDNPLDSPKTSAEELKSFRAAVAGIMNDIAVREKLGVYIEHLSFEKRGLDREATLHLGPDASQMERRGETTDRGDQNRAIEDRNAEREKLHQDRKIVDIEKARERLAQKQQGQQASRKEEAPALSRQDVNPVMGFHPEAWGPFYAETSKRRQEMLDEQERLYAAQEEQLKQRMAALHHSIDDRNRFVRFWRRLIGRTAREQEELGKTTAAYDAIQDKKRLATEAFEQDRQQRMESLKEEYRLKEIEAAEEPSSDAAELAEAEGGQTESGLSETYAAASGDTFQAISGSGARLERVRSQEREKRPLEARRAVNDLRQGAADSESRAPANDPGPAPSSPADDRFERAQGADERDRQASDGFERPAFDHDRGRG